jgi:hypothetical protein
MSKAFKKLAWLEKRDAAKGAMVRTICAVPNDYHTEQLPMIPANTEIKLDFGGDFGFYGVADINGVLHKVRVEIHHLHNVDFGDHV